MQNLAVILLGVVALAFSSAASAASDAEVPAAAGKSDESAKQAQEPTFAVAEKRKFYQWAGKRSQGDDVSEESRDKRKFYQWAGKRSDSSAADDQLLAEKRKFYQWAGKRANIGLEKRKFYQWAGKRSSDSLTDDDSNVPSAEKRRFYQWAG